MDANQNQLNCYFCQETDSKFYVSNNCFDCEYKTVLCEKCNRFLEMIISSDYFKCFACNQIKERIKTEIIKNKYIDNSLKLNDIKPLNFTSTENIIENINRKNNQNNSIVNTNFANNCPGKNEYEDWGLECDQNTNKSPDRIYDFSQKRNNEKWSNNSSNFNICSNEGNNQNSNYWNPNNYSEDVKAENLINSNVNNFSNTRNVTNLNNDGLINQASNGFYIYKSNNTNIQKKTFYSSNDKMQIEDENVFLRINNLGNKNHFNSLDPSDPHYLIKNSFIRNNVNLKASNFNINNDYKFLTNPNAKANYFQNNFFNSDFDNLNFKNNFQPNEQNNLDSNNKNNVLLNNNYLNQTPNKNLHSHNNTNNVIFDVYENNSQNKINTCNKSENVSMKIVTSHKENGNSKCSNFNNNNYSLLGSRSKFNEFHLNTNKPVSNKITSLTNSKFANYNLSEEQFKRNIESPTVNKKLLFMENREIKKEIFNESENLNEKWNSECALKWQMDNSPIDRRQQVDKVQNFNKSFLGFQEHDNNNKIQSFEHNNFFTPLNINNAIINPIKNCEMKNNYKIQSIIFKNNSQKNNVNFNSSEACENQSKSIYNSVNANDLSYLSRSVKPLNTSIVKENTKNQINSKSNVLNRSVDSSFFYNDEVRDKCLNENKSFFEDYLS